MGEKYPSMSFKWEITYSTPAGRSSMFWDYWRWFLQSTFGFVKKIPAV
jgi:hypothetical protein